MMSDAETTAISPQESLTAREILDRFADRVEQVEFRTRVGDLERTQTIRIRAERPGAA